MKLVACLVFTVGRAACRRTSSGLADGSGTGGNGAGGGAGTGGGDGGGGGSGGRTSGPPIRRQAARSRSSTSSSS